MVTQEQADRIEAKLDQLIEFRDQAAQALQAFTSGPMARMLASMAKGMGGGGR